MRSLFFWIFCAILAIPAAGLSIQLADGFIDGVFLAVGFGLAVGIISAIASTYVGKWFDL